MAIIIYIFTLFVIIINKNINYSQGFPFSITSSSIKISPNKYTYNLHSVETTDESDERINKRNDVLIIGGGPAGLCAAIGLHKLGYSDITVLEKRERDRYNTILFYYIFY